MVKKRDVVETFPWVWAEAGRLFRLSLVVVGVLVLLYLIIGLIILLIGVV